MSKELDPNFVGDEHARPDEQPAPDQPATPDLFAAFGLDESLLRAVRDLGFTQPTPVQDKTIPLAMKPLDDATAFNDLMVSSQTGSGKTAAYLLPVLHTLHAELRAQEAKAQVERQRAIDEALAAGHPPPKAPKRKNPMDPRNFKAAAPGALILCPTRELAQQVAHDAIDLARHMRGVRVATVIGGLPYREQIARLQNASIVVATPGRLLDLQRNRQIQCEAVQFLVVDEADRMLDLGFADDLAEINQLTIERRQTMMFSATFEARIQGLARRVMREPQRVTIDTPQERHANIKQVLYWADHAQHKRKLLDHLMRDTTIDQAIVFVSTQIECDALAQDLIGAGFDAAALHGALSQRIRNVRLGLLRHGRIQFLIATDVAARGIDVPTITHVFNFGLPMKTEDYVHRIGRTGRAGRDGLALTIAEHRDRRKIGDIEHYTQQRISVEVVPGLEPTPPKRMAPTRKERERERGARRDGGPRPGHHVAHHGAPMPGRSAHAPARGDARGDGARADPRGGARGGARAPLGYARHAQAPARGHNTGAPFDSRARPSRTGR